MDSIKKIEDKIGESLKGLPHLPENARKWIAKYAGTITAIGLGLSILAFVLVSFVFIATMGLVGRVFTAPYLAYTFSFNYLLSTSIELIELLLFIVITAMAIKPLKLMDEKGWDLLFLISLINLVFSAGGLVSGFSFDRLIGLVVAFFVNIYFLFEIRSYFKKGGAKVADKAKEV